jgi:hypothetical protein
MRGSRLLAALRLAGHTFPHPADIRPMGKMAERVADSLMAGAR